MTIPAVFYQPWVWIAISLAGFGLCMLLPIKIKEDALRRKVMWLVLIPVSLIIIFYVYPMGLEIARRLALR